MSSTKLSRIPKHVRERYHTASKWLDRYESGECTEADLDEFEAWLQIEGNVRAFLSVRWVWADMLAIRGVPWPGSD
jgi:ferric-dicitrate binding protein FerR (iron transport regulator)